jgi:hypothetical protein
MDVRRSVASLLVVLFLASPAGVLATCAGWQSSASERMACCDQHDDDCDSQLAADRCCGGGEQAQQPTLQTTAAADSGTFVTLLPHVWTARSAGPTLVSPSDHRSPSETLPHAPPHLLDTVLLI